MADDFGHGLPEAAVGQVGEELAQQLVGGEGAVAEEAEDAPLALGVMVQGAGDGGGRVLVGAAVAGVEMAGAVRSDALQGSGVGGEAAEAAAVGEEVDAGVGGDAGQQLVAAEQAARSLFQIDGVARGVPRGGEEGQRPLSQPDDIAVVEPAVGGEGGGRGGSRASALAWGFVPW